MHMCVCKYNNDLPQITDNKVEGHTEQPICTTL